VFGTSQARTISCVHRVIIGLQYCTRYLLVISLLFVTHCNCNLTSPFGVTPNYCKIPATYIFYIQKISIYNKVQRCFEDTTTTFHQGNDGYQVPTQPSTHHYFRVFVGNDLCGSFVDGLCCVLYVPYIYFLGWGFLFRPGDRPYSKWITRLPKPTLSMYRF